MMTSNQASDKMESDSSHNDSTPLSPSPNVIVDECKNEPLQQICETIQYKVQNMKTENFGLKEAVKKNKETIKFQAETIDTLKTDKAKIQIQISHLKNAHDEEIAQHEIIINRLNNEIDILQATVKTSVASSSQLNEDKSELQKKCNQLNDAKKKLDVKIREQKEKIQALENESRQMQNQITELTNENVILNAVTPICKIDDVVVGGKINYGRLFGKLLLVDTFVYRMDGKTYADGHEISFEYPNFKVYVQNKLLVRSNMLTSICRVHYNNLNILSLRNLNITYADYKKLVKSCNNIQRVYFNSVTVRDENGEIIEIDRLLMNILEITSNIGSLFYTFRNGEVTSETAQKLAHLSIFPNINKFCFKNVQEGFDFKAFFPFIKKHPTALFKLFVTGSNKFYAQIKRDEEELRAELPETCQLIVYRSSSFGTFWELFYKMFYI